MKRLWLLLLLSFIACKENGNQANQSKEEVSGQKIEVKYAKGFSIEDFGNYKILEVHNPFPESNQSYTYLLVNRGASYPSGMAYDALVEIPVQKMVVTSTTHIPSLEMLKVEQSLVGFPHPDFISSAKTRNRIKDGKVANIGENENINTEILLSLQPEALIGFGMKENDKVYAQIARSGIPVLFNGDWNELHPLGKAEWIKFFGVLYDKTQESDSIFAEIEKSYEDAKELSKTAKEKPKVMAGSLYNDVWYSPGGDSWAAQLLADAHSDYVYKDKSGTGSLSLGFEAVLDRAQDADFWIAPSSYTSYEQMEKDSRHYTQFEAFKEKKIYGYATAVGETGGLLYFELAPNRPDLVLKDLIHIFHPALLPDYEPMFYKPLK